MVKQTVHLAVDLTVNEGRLDAFERIAQEMRVPKVTVAVPFPR